MFIMPPTPLQVKELTKTLRDVLDAFAEAEPTNAVVGRILFDALQAIENVRTDSGAAYASKESSAALHARAILEPAWMAVHAGDPRLLEGLAEAANGVMREKYPAWRPIPGSLQEAAHEVASRLRPIDNTPSRRAIARELASVLSPFVRTPALRRDPGATAQAILLKMPLSHGNSTDKDGTFADEPFEACPRATFRAALVAIGVPSGDASNAARRVPKKSRGPHRTD